MNKYLYHYTSTDTFVEMLKKMHDEKSSYLTFWASNIHYMNDPHELEFLYDELVRVLPEIEKELEIKDMPFSAFSFPKNNEMGLSLNLEHDVLDNVFNKIYKSAYAISFSQREDYMPMWALYGNNGNGLCLKFDYELLKEYVAGEGAKDFGRRIIEIKYNIKDVAVWEKIKSFYLEYYQMKEDSTVDNNPLVFRRSFIAQVLLELSPSMKHQSYDYEEEVRFFDHIIYPGDADDIVKMTKVRELDKKYNKVSDPKVRVKNGLLIPYKEIKIPIKCLSSVIIGPTVNPKLQCEAMDTFFRSLNLDLEVTPSTVPFRQL